MESVSYRLDDLKSGTIKVRTFSTADGPRREPRSLFPNRFIVFKKHEIVFSKAKTIFYGCRIFAIVLLHWIDEHGEMWIVWPGEEVRCHTLHNRATGEVPKIHEMNKNVRQAECGLCSW